MKQVPKDCGFIPSVSVLERKRAAVTLQTSPTALTDNVLGAQMKAAQVFAQNRIPVIHGNVGFQ